MPRFNFFGLDGPRPNDLAVGSSHAHDGQLFLVLVERCQKDRITDNARRRVAGINRDVPQFILSRLEMYRRSFPTGDAMAVETPELRPVARRFSTAFRDDEASQNTT
jgi:hypothetical protein